MKSAKNSILITVYDRENTFKKCLINLSNASNIDDYNLIIVIQKSKLNLMKIINKFDFKQKWIINTNYPKNWNPNKKMAFNGFKGCKFAFEKLKSNFLCYLEDDIIISKDFLQFHEFVQNEYKYDQNFFGINGFSKNNYDKLKIKYYSKFVYGLGKGYSFNSKVWKIIKKKIWTKKFLNQKIPYLDAPVEKFVKDNNYFVVMPIISRIYEYPSQGTNIPLSNKKYFRELKKSFYIKKNNKNLDYIYKPFEYYNWRKDCRKYYGKFINYFYISLKKIFRKILKLF